MMRRFSIAVVIRVLLLTLTIGVLAFIFGDERLYFNHFILFVIVIGQVWELVRYLSHTNRELARLFLAIRHNDFSVSFKETSKGASFRELQNSLIAIMHSFRDVQGAKEAQHHFLQQLVNQIQVGILSWSSDGKLSILNSMAQDLLHAAGTRNVDHLREHHPQFMSEVDVLAPAGKKLIELKTPGGSRFLSLEVSTITILNTPHTLVTFQDINSEIEQKEIEAWHKLIRILTHEIMNSVTPIASLSETVQGLLQHSNGIQKQLPELTEESIADIRFSIQTIRKRSEGLLEFVDSYRKLTRIPTPNKLPVRISELLESIRTLMKAELEARGITLTYELAFHKEEPIIVADRALIEQVLINLISNASYAIGDRQSGEITLSARKENDATLIAVTDNGRGIPEKELSHIFVPFYSTRKDGSGIGLSLCKQIMHAHGGTIRVESEVDKGTKFTLTFLNA